MRVIALLMCVATVVARVEVNFDFSWRVQTVDPTQKPDMSKKDSNYSDESWAVVDAPHDFLINGGYEESASSKQANIPRKNAWYRKHFVLPEDFSDHHITLYFEGIFKLATVFLNGNQIRYHETGYTSFQARLDNNTFVQFGDNSPNVLAIYVDGSIGSGWWYEGAGIYRHVKLLVTEKVHFEIDGVNAPTHSLTVDSEGKTATDVVLNTTFSIASSSVLSTSGLSLSLSLFGPEGNVVSQKSTNLPTIAANATTDFKYDFTVGGTVDVWSIRNPALYTLQSVIMNGTLVVDSVNTTVGFRSLQYTADSGFYLNKQHFKVRGFCDHNNFASVGMGVPDRVKLFAAQTLRSVGGNGRRMSHNPPEPVMLEIYDRIGVVVMDENRDFQTNNTDDVGNMGAMVKRDRNHPSITIWSYCNEGGCSTANGTGAAYRNITYLYDGTRPTLGNDVNDADLNKYMDVQGFSHRNRGVFLNYHKQFPKKPTFASECCSCESMRGEDFVNKTSNATYSDFNGGCVAEQVEISDGLDFVSGTMVWTLFDYYGEAHWPLVTSAYGQLDIAGFWKASAHWYQTWWRANITDTSYDKAPLDDIPYTCHIVEHWSENTTNRTIHVYTNGKGVNLSSDNTHIGFDVVGYRQYATFEDVIWKAGECLTATVSPVPDSDAPAVTCTRCAVEDHSVNNIDVSIDAPSKATGTGSALYADGQDVALIRATLQDSAGNLATDSSNTITFEVVSGPGRIVGTHNGDQRNHHPNNATSVEAFHGLARCIVQVTEDYSGSLASRQLLSQVTADTTSRTKIVTDPNAKPSDIVIKATSPGLTAGTITIPVSADPSASVLSTAAANNRF